MGWVNLVMIASLNVLKACYLEGIGKKKTFYTVKSRMRPLDLGYQKINIYLNFCMLHYNEYKIFPKCKTCQHAWYKPNSGRERTFVIYKKIRHFSISFRLQRLFISSKTVEHMTWHHSYDTVDGVMVHLSDGEAWK